MADRRKLTENEYLARKIASIDYDMIEQKEGTFMYNNFMGHSFSFSTYDIGRNWFNEGHTLEEFDALGEDSSYYEIKKHKKDYDTFVIGFTTAKRQKGIKDRVYNIGKADFNKGIAFENIADIYKKNSDYLSGYLEEMGKNWFLQGSSIEEADEKFKNNGNFLDGYYKQLGRDWCMNQKDVNDNELNAFIPVDNKLKQRFISSFSKGYQEILGEQQTKTTKK